ncbi:MAG: DUF4040 domain-containing protein [Arenicellales bacterium]|nr:DUF4040 domain-containing protein [Arenicellales bacterium]
MNTLSWSFLDILLVIALVLLAGAALRARSLRQSIILFIAFGLVTALVWARLRAPDVALAEAAIGAGLTGALLLTALRNRPSEESRLVSNNGMRWGGRWGNVAITVSVSLVALGIGWAVLYGMNDTQSGRLAGQVGSALELSGVSNPVTAVLLNFRAYDTLLELAVLLAALLGILSLGGGRATHCTVDPIATSLRGWLVPLLILTAGYQLWVGAHAPGGAFQAGALLAAAGVVQHLAGRAHAGLPVGAVLRVLMVSGIGIFMTMGLWTFLGGRGFLAYPQRWAGELILLIELFATLAIAVTLILCYLGSEPERRRITPAGSKP